MNILGFLFNLNNPFADFFGDLFGRAARWGFLYALEKLGVFHWLKIALVLFLVLFIAGRLFRKSRKFLIIVLVVALALMEREAPGERTYALPTSLNPTTSQVTFTIDDRTLPGWAEWMRQHLPGQESGPKVTTEESDSSANPE